MTARRHALAFTLAVVAYALGCGRASAILCGTFLTPITVTATSVSFGNYLATSPSALFASGTISVSCSALGIDLLPNYTVALSRGMASGYAPRTMKLGGNALQYNLYTSATYADIWGDGTSGTVTQNYSSNLGSSSANFTVFGRLPAGQFVVPGAYSDLITVTVTY